MSIRVLVAEDSTTVRKRLREVLANAPDFEVIGEAADGKQAIAMCQALRPNVMTLDMMMPEMTGLAATEYIMAHCPTPILIVSSSTNRGELFKTYDALAAGAVDVLEKPLGDDSDADWERRFVAAVKMVARIPVITHPRARLAGLTRHAEPPSVALPGSLHRTDLVAIGASTGGPGAVVSILQSLPANYSPPVLVVVHIGERFAAAFAEWVDGQVALQVRYAKDGERLVGHGTVLMAPPGSHLIVRGGRVRLTTDPERHSCRPSVDVLFESLADEYAGRAVACLLTGMGRDGALGLQRIRSRGGLTIAQDEATSVVYGMPREAALLNAASSILPLPEIGPVLAELGTRGR